MFQIDWPLVWVNSASMAIAYLLALPIAWNREAQTRSAGLRTFPLVSIASCGFMLIAISAMPDTGSQARVVQGIITGIGFIGGGAILKGNSNVTGTATAASIWATAAIGISVALYRYEIALVVSLLTFVTLQFLGKAKKAVRQADGE
ncbi:MAG: MgtC/SapB family protein [Gammaproteobacteria bacterium]|nr:MgtC/SapB family protein [Gammaproteobacteria bacterium]MBT8150755.1 MgtC/SapB family protein [Gammaproteobacteria bacterium]NND38156.1 MgtC/SapB family protein [Pseudomonadales bacterium]NNM11619.1 MgtC/SapB family protein [Pseudomonadales bacterium]